MSLRSTRYSVFLPEGKSRYLIRLLQDFLMLKLTPTFRLFFSLNTFYAMKTKAILLGLVVMLGACSNEKSTGLDGYTIVRGKLLDAATLEPISGGRVTVHEDWVEMDTTTGGDGSYYFQFKHKEGCRYALTAEANHYLGNTGVGIWAADYLSGKASPEQLIETSIENVMNTKLPPEGFVKYIIKQVNTYSENIEVSITPYSSLTVITYTGTNLKRTYIDKLPGGTGYKINYGLKIGDSTYYHEENLFIPRFDTLKYTIEF